MTVTNHHIKRMRSLAHHVRTFVTSPKMRDRDHPGVGEEVRLTWDGGKPVTWKIIKGESNGKFVTALEDDRDDNNQQITGKGTDRSGKSTETDAKLTNGTWTGTSIWFIAGDKAEDVTIQANDHDTITFTVVEPESWKLKRISTVSHPKTTGNGDISCLWFGKVYIQPADVNFYRIQVREEDSLAKGNLDNNWLKYSIGQHHGQGYHLYDDEGNLVSEWVSFDFHTEEDGSAMWGHDTVGAVISLDNPPVPGRSPNDIPGHTYTPITFQWKIIGVKAYHKFNTIEHGEVLDLDKNGDFTVSKGGESVTTRFDDQWTGAPELLQGIHPGHNQ